MSNQAGKGDAPRPIDRKGWDACPLWENMKKVAELKNCTGDPDEVYVLEFQPDEINIKCDPDSKNNYGKFKKQAYWWQNDTSEINEITVITGSRGEGRIEIKKEQGE